MFLFVTLNFTAFRILCLLLSAIAVFQSTWLDMRKNREPFNQSINQSIILLNTDLVYKMSRSQYLLLLKIHLQYFKLQVITGM